MFAFYRGMYYGTCIQNEADFYRVYRVAKQFAKKVLRPGFEADEADENYLFGLCAIADLLAERMNAFGISEERWEGLIRKYDFADFKDDVYTIAELFFPSEGLYRGCAVC